MGKLYLLLRPHVSAPNSISEFLTEFWYWKFTLKVAVGKVFSFIYLIRSPIYMKPMFIFTDTFKNKNRFTFKLSFPTVASSGFILNFHLQ
jgi:hypothetical protein